MLCSTETVNKSCTWGRGTERSRREFERHACITEIYLIYAAPKTACPALGPAAPRLYVLLGRVLAAHLYTLYPNSKNNAVTL